MTFQPYPTRSGFVALLVAIFFCSAAIYLLKGVLQPNQETLIAISQSLALDTVATTFMLLVGCLLALLVAGAAIYWAIIILKLNYHLDRNSLSIQWGLTQYRIPFDTIETVIPGQTLPATAKFRQINFTGLRLGQGRLADYGPLKFRSTASLADSLLVATPQQTYVISPHRPEQFLRAWQERQALGSTQVWSATVHRSWPLNSPLLADRLAWWLLGLAALLWLALVGYLALNFTNLPTLMPTHFNALGHADRIAGKVTLLILPAAGALVWLVNTLVGELVYLRERIAAYFLWASAIVMQVCLWVALRMIIG